MSSKLFSLLSTLAVVVALSTVGGVSAQSTSTSPPSFGQTVATTATDRLMTVHDASALLALVTQLNTNTTAVQTSAGGTPVYVLRSVADAAFTQAYGGGTGQTLSACASGDDTGVFSYPFADRCMADLQLGQAAIAMDRPRLRRRATELEPCTYTDVKCVDPDQVFTTADAIIERITQYQAKQAKITQCGFPSPFNVFAPRAAVEDLWARMGNTSPVCTATSATVPGADDPYQIIIASQKGVKCPYPDTAVKCLL